MAVWKEEVFGPVLPIIPFDSEDEAIAFANDSQYGLGGYIYTQNKERALKVGRHLQTGNISINGANYVIPQDPFGGYKNSGLGRESSPPLLLELPPPQAARKAALSAPAPVEIRALRRVSLELPNFCQ